MEPTSCLSDTSIHTAANSATAPDAGATPSAGAPVSPSTPSYATNTTERFAQIVRKTRSLPVSINWLSHWLRCGNIRYAKETAETIVNGASEILALLTDIEAETRK